MAISKDVTISEIAARADVSIATVSRVINQIGKRKQNKEYSRQCQN